MTVGAPLPAASPSGTQTARTKREGVILAGLVDPVLHELDGALLVSVRVGPEERERKLYRVQDDALVPLPGPPTRWHIASYSGAVLGRWPDRVYAHGFTLGADPVLLQLETKGWRSVSINEKLYDLVWWSDRVMGLVGDPSVPFGRKLTRLDAPGEDVPIPAAAGPLCDTFYQQKVNGLFPPFLVQPRALASVGGQLFVIGFGCAVTVAFLSWDHSRSTPRLHTLEERSLFDALPGEIVGGEGSDIWYRRSPMRPATEAALWRFDGRAWSQAALPVKDPDLDSIAVDGHGSLWAAMEGKLFTRRGDGWKEHAAVPGCEHPDGVAVDARSLWLACEDAVARIPIPLKPSR